MKFSIEKKGYNIEEVDAYLKKLAANYSSTLQAQQSRNLELRSELQKLEQEVAKHKEKAPLISRAILSAVQKAEEIKVLSTFRYEQELARLQAFSQKWNDYYNKLLSKYGHLDEVKRAENFSNKVNAVFNNISNISEKTEELEAVYESEKKRLGMQKIGYITLSDEDNPINRITNYFNSENFMQDKPTETAVTKVRATNFLDANAAENSGFSFEEALNPKDDLETIMKELGAMIGDR